MFQLETWLNAKLESHQWQNAFKIELRIFKTQSCKTFFHFIGSLYYELDTFVFFLYSLKKERRIRNQRIKNLMRSWWKKASNSYSIRDRDENAFKTCVKQWINNHRSYGQIVVYFFSLFYISVYDEAQPLFLAALWRKPIFLLLLAYFFLNSHFETRSKWISMARKTARKFRFALFFIFITSAHFLPPFI